MYCPACGKQIPDGSRFCFLCGAAVPTAVSQPSAPPAPSAPTEWEYSYYVQCWELGKGGKYYTGGGHTEVQARHYFWGGQQKWINPEIQEYLDNGWEPITEIGPNGFTFRYRTLNNDAWYEMRDFRVKFRRPKRQGKPAPLAALLGKWESVEVIKHGLVAGLMVGIGSALGMYAKGYVYEFFDDYRFEGSSKGVNKNNWGIFDFFEKNTKFAILTDKQNLIDQAHVIVCDITGPNEFLLHTPDKGVEIVYRKI